MIPRMFRCFVIFVLAAAASASAQETRGTIAGHVFDEQGGAMPGVSVTITNVDTNVSATLTTNSTGYYQAPLLLPGNYRVSAELQGFKTSVRSGVILSVAQQATVDLTLGVGALSETVTVSGEAPILETGVLTTGQNLDRRSVESLPMFSNMPVLLTRFVTGVNSSANVPYVAQGFVNRTSSDTSAPGGVGGNEWTIDGATNNGSDRRLASSPNSDMIEEVRIETANFDASFGHGTGLGISMMTRSGTNATRGTLNYQYWNNQWNAPRYFAKRNYYNNIEQARARGDNALADSLASQKINSIGKSNNVATTFGGPIIRNKLFAFVNYSYNADDRPVNPTQHTIPTDAHLRGDFSDLLAIDPVRYQIYDPLSVRPDPAASRVLHPRSVSGQHHSGRTGSSTRCTSTTSSCCRSPTTTRRIPARSPRTTISCAPTPIRFRARSTARASTTTTRIRTGSSAGGAAATSPRGSTTGRTRAPRSTPKT